MRKYFLFVLILIWAPQICLASFPDTIQNESQLELEGYTHLNQFSGDLNQDNKDDLVFLLEKNGVSRDEMFEKSNRILLVYFNNGTKNYKKVLESHNILMCSLCGGMMGDPLYSSEINRGSILINHYGGTSHRWGYSHRYRFQNGDWYLIGFSRSESNTFENSSKDTDINLLTGQYETKIHQHDKDSIKKGKIKVDHLPKLSEWDWNHVESFLVIK